MLPLAVPKPHRRGAWSYYALILAGFVIFAIITIVKAVRARDNPPVAMKYILEDVQLPDVILCPEVSQFPYAELGSFAASCLLVENADSYSGGVKRVAHPRGSQGVLNWSKRGSDDGNFTYTSDSHCEVTTFESSVTEESDPRLCFKYNLQNFKAKKLVVAKDRAFIDVGLGFNYLGNTTSREFVRTMHYIATYSQADPIGDRLIGQPIPLGGVIPGTLHLTRRRLISKKEIITADWISSSLQYNTPDDYPLQDFVRVTVSFDRRGTFEIKEQNPLNALILLGALSGAWGAISVVFGLLFPLQEERESVIQSWKSKRAFSLKPPNPAKETALQEQV